MKRKLAGLIALVAAWTGLLASGFAATSILTQSASPLTITFSANDPDTPTVSGSSSATITFSTNGGKNGNTWTVQVQATTANFGSCPSTVPVTQVTVSCASATVGGGGGTGACFPSGTLSTALRTVASGTEGAGGGQTYTVTLNFTFTDSWGYVATPSGAPCTISLNYLITAN